MCIIQLSSEMDYKTNLNSSSSFPNRHKCFNYCPSGELAWLQTSSENQQKNEEYNYSIKIIPVSEVWLLKL